MKINGINGANTQMGQMGMNQATDSYSRNAQICLKKSRCFSIMEPWQKRESDGMSAIHEKGGRCH